MNSIIICEGETDFALLQYYMIKVNEWNDSGYRSFKTEIKDSKSRDFIKESRKLTIVSASGCANIKTVLDAVIRFNQNEITDDNRYTKIAIITDNDEQDTEQNLIQELKESCGTNPEIKNQTWSEVSFIDSISQEFKVELIPMIIPFNENGALETFLLNSIKDKDEYDAKIIEKGNNFVETADPEKKYLNHRSLVTKAKFDVYFSIRTAAKQFSQRQDILKNVPWEEYIQKSFIELANL